MKRNFWKILKADDGLTFAETVVSLTILSIVMVVLFRLGSSLLPILSEQRTALIHDRRELILREALTTEFDKITPAWWLAEYEPGEEDAKWIFPWYEGEKEKTLCLTVIDGTLFIGSDEENRYAIQGITALNIKLLTNTANAPWLAEIELDGFITKKMYFPLGNTIVPGKEVE